MAFVDNLFEGAPKMLNPQQLAELLGVSRQTVLNWIDTKSIPAYRFSEGSRWMIFRDEILEFMKKSRTIPLYSEEVATVEAVPALEEQPSAESDAASDDR